MLISEFKAMKILTFMKLASYVINCYRLIFTYESNQSTCGCELKTATENLQQNAQTQDADGIQAMSVL